MRSTISLSESRPLDGDEVKRSLLLASLGAATLAASFAYAPWAESGPVLCPFRLLTGLPCPGCGLTRSFCAMAHGNWHSAMGFHLFGPALFVAVAICVPLLAFQAATGRRIRWLQQVLYSQRLAAWIAAGWMTYHVARLVQMGSAGLISAGLRQSLLAVVLRPWLG
jgi:hypothetical protein